jgi:hypothetical protein
VELNPSTKEVRGESVSESSRCGPTYKKHLDGYNNLDYWTGKSDKLAQWELFCDDETDLVAAFGA